MSYKCDKRNYRHFKNGERFYRIGTELASYEKDSNKDLIYVNKPNLVAVYLNIADKASQEAKELYNEKIISNLEFDSKSNEFKIIDSNPDSIIFDFFEKIFIAIIFSFTAIEAFINSLIPGDSYIEVKIKGELKKINNKYIQKNISFEEKIKYIIPQIFKIELITNKLPFWRNLTNLKKYRNELIHLKKEENIKTSAGNLKSSQLEFLIRIIESCIKEDIIESARELIKFLSKKIGNNPEIPYEFYDAPFDINELKVL